MLSKLNEIFKNPRFQRTALSVLISVAVIGLLFLAFHPAFAAEEAASGLGDKVQAKFCQILGWLVYYILIWPVSHLLTLVICILVWVSGYNNFIKEAPVAIGWTMVRDVCNMFFIVGLLIIAFGTVLKIEKYLYTKMLWKLLLAAVIVNFSKMICGLLIDVSQVVMLTFVNAYSDIAAGNLTNALGIFEIMQMGQNLEITDAKMLISLILGAIFLIIALIITISLVVIMTMRIVNLWILVILSPLAFTVDAFPMDALKKITNNWWDKFVNFLVIGPVLAFFLWLTFSVTAAGKISTKGGFADSTIVPKCAQSGVESLVVGATKIGTADMVFNFIIVIGLLIGSMAMAQQLGGGAGGAAKAVYGKVSGRAQKIAMGATGAAALQRRYAAWQSSRESGKKQRAAAAVEKIPTTLPRAAAVVPGLGAALQRVPGFKKVAREEKSRQMALQEKGIRGFTPEERVRKANTMADIPFNRSRKTALVKSLVGTKEFENLHNASIRQAVNYTQGTPEGLNLRKSILSGHEKKSMESIFNNFNAPKDVDNFMTTHKNKELDASKYFGKMSDATLNQFLQGAGNGDKKEGLKKSLGSLDEQGLSAIFKKLAATDEIDAKTSQPTGRKLSSMADELAYGDVKDLKEKDRMNAEKASGRYGQFHNLADEKERDSVRRAMEEDKGSTTKNMHASALENKDIIKMLSDSKQFNENDLKNMTSTKANQEAYNKGSRSMIDENYKNDYSSKESQHAREMHLKLGGKVEEVFSLQTDAGLGAFEKGLQNNTIKMEHVMKSEGNDLGVEAISSLAKNILSGKDFANLFKNKPELATQVVATKDIPEEIINKSGVAVRFHERMEEEIKSYQEKVREGIAEFEKKMEELSRETERAEQEGRTGDKDKLIKEFDSLQKRTDNLRSKLEKKEGEIEYYI